MRRAVVRIHRWLGAASGVLLALAGLSGSALVLRERIERVQRPELYTPPATSVRLPVQTVFDCVQRAFPTFRIGYVQLPEGSLDPIVLTLGGKGNPMIFVHADPSTGKVLGVRRSGEGWLDWVALWHYNLRGGRVGGWINGAVAIILCVMALTGAILWRPRLRVHYVVGILSCGPLMAIGVTGALFVWPMKSGGIDSVPARSSSIHVEPALDEWIATARRARPDASVTAVLIPGPPSSTITVRMGGDRVLIDGSNGRVVSVVLASKFSGYAIHSGGFGGGLTRGLWFFAGLAPAALWVTGLAMWRRYH